MSAIAAEPMAARVSASQAETAPVLEVSDLRIGFGQGPNLVAVVRDVSFAIMPGQSMGLVGESGAGKSITALGIMRLLPRGARQLAGTVRLAGRNLTAASERDMARLRGDVVGMIFQDPLTSLNPAFSVGRQLTDAIRAHRAVGTSAAMGIAADLLALVGITSPRARLASFPHELSGGMRQRVAIAIAVACEPKLLIADEPTTALDVTVQAQVIELLARLKEEINLSLLFISHNLDLVAEVCDVVSVMYAGAIVEANRVEAIFGMPRHPYTRELLRCVPRLTDGSGPLPAIPGEPPRMETLPPGCAFTPRCSQAHHRCRLPPPTVADADGRVCCWLAT